MKSIDEIIKLVSSILPVVVDLDDVDRDLQELDIDSLDFIRIIVLLEEQYEIEIPDEYLMFSEMNSIRKIHSVINEVMGSA